MTGPRSILLLLAAFLTLTPAPSVRADEFSDNFSANINQQTLDALASDIGALVGAPSFHHGKALGFPLGFDVGVHAAIVGVDNEDKILRDNGSTARSGWVQAEYGLPGRVNLIGRIGQLYDADLYGGGLRWGVFTSAVPGLPSISFSALYGKAKHDLFHAETFSGNLVATFEIPFIHPYVGAGYDKTSLDPTDRAIASAAPGTATNLDGSGEGFRFEAGVNLSVIPFTYLSLGGGVANGRKLGHLGLGVRF